METQMTFGERVADRWRSLVAAGFISLFGGILASGWW